jgi:hypothetical protein
MWKQTTSQQNRQKELSTSSTTIMPNENKFMSYHYHAFRSVRSGLECRTEYLQSKFRELAKFINLFFPKVVRASIAATLRGIPPFAGLSVPFDK